MEDEGGDSNARERTTYREHKERMTEVSACALQTQAASRS